MEFPWLAFAVASLLTALITAGIAIRIELRKFGAANLAAAHQHNPGKRQTALTANLGPIALILYYAPPHGLWIAAAIAIPVACGVYAIVYYAMS